MKNISILLIGLLFIFSAHSVFAGKKQLLNLGDVTGGKEIRGVVHDPLVNG
jgi:hypothetical protein